MQLLVEIDGAGGWDMFPMSIEFYDNFTVKKVDDLKVKQALVGLSLSENGGDIADSVVEMAELLGMPKPEWDDEKRRMVFPFESTEDMWRGVSNE